MTQPMIEVYGTVMLQPELSAQGIHIQVCFDGLSAICDLGHRQEEVPTGFVLQWLSQVPFSALVKGVHWEWDADEQYIKAQDEHGDRYMFTELTQLSNWWISKLQEYEGVVSEPS